jgi:hypothetical protein
MVGQKQLLGLKQFGESDKIPFSPSPWIKKMNHYAALKVAIASIEAILSNQTLSKDVRMEFESNKKNLINLLRFL